MCAELLNNYCIPFVLNSFFTAQRGECVRHYSLIVHYSLLSLICELFINSLLSYVRHVTSLVLDSRVYVSKVTVPEHSTGLIDSFCLLHYEPM